MKSCSTFIPVLVLATALSACSWGGNGWPNLSDPLPDPAERNRVTERAAPSSSKRTEDATPLTEQAAMTLYNEVRDALLEEQEAYRQARAAFEAASDDEKEESWLAAQIALTRLSSTASRLDPIFEAESLPAGPRTLASDMKQNYMPFVIAERQFLTASEPR